MIIMLWVSEKQLEKKDKLLILYNPIKSIRFRKESKRKYS